MLYDDKLAMAKKLKIESATFQKILDHLRKNPDVQNIDMMNLANFCRIPFRYTITAEVCQIHHVNILNIRVLSQMIKYLLKCCRFYF